MTNEVLNVESHDFQYEARVFRCSCFEVIGNTDTTEGRGMSTCIGVFDKRIDAEYAAKGAGVMGRNAEIRNRIYDIVVPLHGGKEFWDEAKVLGAAPQKFVIEFIDPIELRKAALAKLTQSERELLGLV